MHFYEAPSRERLYQLLFLQGLTPQEAARALGISWAQMRKHIMYYGLDAKSVAIALARERYLTTRKEQRGHKKTTTA